VYTLFLAVDANFKLKRKNRGINDPELAPGWASFVEEGAYQTISGIMLINLRFVYIIHWLREIDGR
jgi:hypothetical protein